MKIKDEVALLTVQVRIEAKDIWADLAADPEVALGAQCEQNLNQVTLAQDRKEDRVEGKQHPPRLYLDQLIVKTRKPLLPTKDTHCVVTDNSVTSAPLVDPGGVFA